MLSGELGSDGTAFSDEARCLHVHGTGAAASQRISDSLTEVRLLDLVIHMKTTLNIDDSVMERLKAEAARRGTTMSALVEEGLRRILEEPRGDAMERSWDPPTWQGGQLRVDISNRDVLYAAMESETDSP